MAEATDKEKQIEDRQIDKQKFFKKGLKLLKGSKCLLHKETDASKVDPEV